MSLLFCVLDEIACVLWIQSHHHIPEVSPVYHPTYWKWVRHVALELRILDHLWVVMLDRQLVVVRDVHHLDLLHFKKHLFFSQNLLEEVFVYTEIRRNVELTKGSVRDELVSLTVVLWSTLWSHFCFWTCLWALKADAIPFLADPRTVVATVAALICYRTFIT